MAGKSRNVDVEVSISGEQKYKQAITELNAANKTLGAEMKRLAEEYKGNEDSMSYLTQKGEKLQDMLDHQREKIEQLKEAVKLSSQLYGEASTKTQSLAQQLANAETSAIQLERAIEENNATMEDNAKDLGVEEEALTGLGETLDQVASKFGISIPSSVKEALNGVEGFSAGTVTKMAVAAAAVAAVIKVVKELGELTLQVASEMDEYLTESQITGVSTEMLQAWDYAAPLIDTDAETIKGAMVKITKAMADAKDGSATAAAKFEELGVSVLDVNGNMRKSEDVFYDVINALKEMAPGAERDAAAMELMGKSAQELNPLINAGSDALKDYGEEAKQVGYILNSDQVKALGAVDDAYQTLQNTIEGVKRQVAADFAPAAEKAMDLFSGAVQKAGEWLERSGLIENLSSILGSMMSILEAIGKTVANMPGLGTALDTLNVSLKAVAYTAALIADTFNVIAGLMPRNWGSGMARTALGWNMGQGQLSNIQQLKFGSGEYASSVYDENLGKWVGNGYNATGNDNWRGGLTWVGEAGPELVALPSGSQILNAQDSRGFGGDTFYITIDAASVKEFNDIVEIAQSARVRSRMR